MITTRDVLFLYNLFHWGGLIVLAIAACVIFYRVNPEFVKKYPFLIVLPGVLVFGLSYVGDLREKAKMEYTKMNVAVKIYFFIGMTSGVQIGRAHV